MRNKIWGFFIIVLTTILLFNIEAQAAPDCVDSTPFCPCLLADGTCFDIDVPLDSGLIFLVLAAMILGYFKLRTSRTQLTSLD